jgi:hypothetical protein
VAAAGRPSRRVEVTNLLWHQQPLVATSAFSPFTGEAAGLPPTQRSCVPFEAGRLRPSSKPGATARTVPRNLLEMGLACGDGAAALEERRQQAEAAKREGDRATGDRALSDQVGDDRGGRSRADAGDQAEGGPQRWTSGRRTRGRTRRRSWP